MNEYNTLFYDIETNGLLFFETGILQCTLINSNRNVLMDQYAYPFNNIIREDALRINHIDNAKLKEKNAVLSSELCHLFKKTVINHLGKKDVYFVSHNNFGYDQIIIEIHFKRAKIQFPKNWYFVDSYPILRKILPSMPNYKLKTIYEKLFSEKDEKVDFHSALDDTLALYDIYHKMQAENPFLFHEVAEHYTRPSMRDFRILECPLELLHGTANLAQFEKENIITIGHLYHFYKRLKFNNEEMYSFLKGCKIRMSEMYAGKVLSLLNALMFFLE